MGSERVFEPAAAQHAQRQSRIPASRIERLGRFGLLAGELAAGAAAEGVRRFFGFAPAPALLLSAPNARRLARRLANLRGAAMKVGQMLSLQSESLLPPELAAALATLRASADVMPVKQLERVLARNYGAAWRTRFTSFDFAPIAAASIGQVHRACTCDGRSLALKIQYPGVGRSIDSDVRNVSSVLRWARLLPRDFDLSPLLTEAKRQLRRETDYQIEASFQRHYRDLVADEPRLVVPQVHDDLTTSHILAMDYIDGLPIEVLFQHRGHQQRSDEIGTLLFRLALRELFEFRFLQSDPNFANYLFLPASGRIGLLDFGGSRTIPPRLAAGYASLLDAGMANDRPALRAAIQAIGFCGQEEERQRVDALMELFLIGCEPFRHRGAYDCARSTMPVRARDVGIELALGRGFLHRPPPDTVFLHRKLAGTFLLCAQLGAHVDMRALLLEALATYGQRSP